jgi:hypothetical protein
VIVADVNPLSRRLCGRRLVRRADGRRPGYIDTILAICDQEGIGLVVPTIDDELVIFGQARRRSRPAFARRLAGRDQPDLQRKLLTGALPSRVEDRGRRNVAAPGLSDTPSFPLFIKPRWSGASARCHPQRPRAPFFRDYVDARHSGLSRRPGVHDRHLLRLSRTRARSCRASGSSSARASTAAAPCASLLIELAETLAQSCRLLARPTCSAAWSAAVQSSSKSTRILRRHSSHDAPALTSRMLVDLLGVLPAIGQFRHHRG